MIKKKKYSEEEIASVVIDWLESMGWDVYQEVQFYSGSPVADIVALKNDDVWIIETKTSLSLQVLAQADHWRSHFKSIAIPSARSSKGRNLAFRICERYLNIGVLEVFPSLYSVRVLVKSEKYKASDGYIDRIKRTLSPLHKEFAKAGSAGSNHLTNYKYTMIQVKEFIQNNPGCSMNEIIDKIGKGHYSSESSAKQNIRKALMDWEDWCNYKYTSKGYIYFAKEI